MAPGASLFLDGSSLAYRAYHAIPGIVGADGKTETNAIYGFLGFLARLIPDRRPSRLWVALDNDWRPQWRVDALPAYKSHRLAGPDDEPDPVEPQIPMICEVLDALGISTCEAAGYEAEDAISALAKKTPGPIEIVTGDRDLFQLVRDQRVMVLYTLRGVSELAPVDQKWITEKYRIPGDRYMDYAILRGDPSDGLPGVSGIGEKTASDLLRKYGSLDGILAATDLSPTIRLKLKNAADYLVGARRVVAMAEDCPVTGGDGSVPAEPKDRARLKELGERWRVDAAIERVLAGLRLASAAA